MRPLGISKWWGRRAGTSAAVVSTTAIFSQLWVFVALVLAVRRTPGRCPPFWHGSLSLLWGWPSLLPALSSPWPGPSSSPLLSAQRFLTCKSSLPPLTFCLKSHLSSFSSCSAAVSLLFSRDFIDSLPEGLAPSERSFCPSSPSICFTALSLFDCSPCCALRFPKSSLIQVPWFIPLATHSRRVSSSPVSS